jgi:hypothetical protein
MVSKQGLLKRINEDWGEKSQSRICIEILNYLLNANSSNTLYFTYGSLRAAIQIACEDSELLMAIQYLCGDGIHLLDAKFELIENDEHIEISRNEIITARANGRLIHPDSGELIDHFEEKVYLYFQPSSLVKSIVLQ